MNELAQSLKQTKIYIQSILPTTPLWTTCPLQKINTVNREIEQYALKLGFYWIDLFSEFATIEGYMKKHLTDDGLHLNNEGYALWAKILKNYDIS
jgi:lysophospholipase L1-like esterase